MIKINESEEFPFVSVIVPCYNCGLYVDDAIASLVNQTYGRLEILLCDDASADGTYERLQLWEKKDARIRVFQNEENRGISHTLNRLVDFSTGEYIARMDADDISDPARIEKQVRFLQDHPAVGLCGTYALHIDERGKKIGQSRLPVHYDDIKESMKFFCPVYHPTVMGRRMCFEKYRYSEDLLCAQDYELWCRMVYQEKICIENIPELLLKYRVLKTSITGKNHVAQRQTGARILEKYHMVPEECRELHGNLFFLRGAVPEEDMYRYSVQVLLSLSRRHKFTQEVVSEKIVSYFWRHRYLGGVLRLCRFKLVRRSFVRMVCRNIESMRAVPGK